MHPLRNTTTNLTFSMLACLAFSFGTPVVLGHGERSTHLPSDAEGLGCISGIVLDAEGRPVGQAKVEAEDIHRPQAGIIPTTTTTEYGTFTLCDLSPGSYTVVASKEQDYYPNPLYTFYSDGKSLPEVPLKTNENLENIVVRLGPRGARLKGRIIDAVTGDPVITKEPQSGPPISKANIDFYEAKNPQPYMGMGTNIEGEFNVLVPIKPFRMKVSAPGYKTWYYGDDGSEERAKAILLPPASTKELTVVLIRIADTPP
jgi:carboxypeptidase family protein